MIDKKSKSRPPAGESVFAGERGRQRERESEWERQREKVSGRDIVGEREKNRQIIITRTYSL